MTEQTIVVKQVEQPDLSLETERILKRQAAIAARMANFKSVRDFEIAALRALIKAYPPMIQKPA